MDLWVGWGIEHFTVLTRLSWDMGGYTLSYDDCCICCVHRVSYPELYIADVVAIQSTQSNFLFFSANSILCMYALGETNLVVSSV